jgi:hypothetical protein
LWTQTKSTEASGAVIGFFLETGGTPGSKEVSPGWYQLRVM